MVTKKTTTKGADDKAKPSKASTYNPRTISNYVHFAGIPCVEDESKPLIDIEYTYRKEDVTCKACQKTFKEGN